MAKQSAKDKAAKDKARREKNKTKVKADAKAKTASAAKGTKPVKAAAQTEGDTEVRKLPGKKSIQQLSKDYMAASDRASTQAGLAGELISNAVKKIHLNAREFKRAHAFKSLGMRDPAKLRTALSDFDYYREALELDKLAGDGLFDAGEGRPEIVEDDEDTETDSPAIAADAEEREGAPVH